MVETVKDLIEKLKDAAGPDRELDADILEATGGCAHRETEYYCIEDGNDVDSGFTCKRCHKDTYGENVPKFTASIDEALTLLPSAEIELTNLYGAARVTVHNLGGDIGPYYGSNECNSLPVAICIAAITARSESEGRQP